MTTLNLELRHPDERVAAQRTPEEQRAHEAREVAQHYEHDPEIFSLVLDKRLAYATGVFLVSGRRIWRRRRSGSTRGWRPS